MAFTNKKINKDGLLTVKVLPEELKNIVIEMGDETFKLDKVPVTTPDGDKNVLVFFPQPKVTE